MPKALPVPQDAALDVRALDADGCAWCAVLGDRTAGEEIHHRLPRGRARNLHDRHNMVLLCGAHHREAHATARWPWLVPGQTIRERYVGPDACYHAAYNGAMAPTLGELRDLFPDSTDLERAWAIGRVADL